MVASNNLTGPKRPCGQQLDRSDQMHHINANLCAKGKERTKVRLVIAVNSPLPCQQAIIRTQRPKPWQHVHQTSTGWMKIMQDSSADYSYSSPTTTAVILRRPETHATRPTTRRRQRVRRLYFHSHLSRSPQRDAAVLRHCALEEIRSPLHMKRLHEQKLYNTSLGII